MAQAAAMAATFPLGVPPGLGNVYCTWPQPAGANGSAPGLAVPNPAVTAGYCLPYPFLVPGGAAAAASLPGGAVAAAAAAATGVAPVAPTAAPFPPPAAPAEPTAAATSPLEPSLGSFPMSTLSNPLESATTADGLSSSASATAPSVSEAD